MARLPRLSLVVLLTCAAMTARATGEDQTAQQAAQQAPQLPTPTFRAAVSLVRVDVSVADRDGKPITGLQAADFEIEEDDVPQKVDTVQFIELDGTRRTDVNDSLEIRSQAHADVEAARDDVRLFAIFLDDYHINRNPEYAVRAKSVLGELVKKLGPNDLIAIMDPLTPLSALRFTRARDALLARIDEFEGRRGRFTPPRSQAESEQLGQPNPDEVRVGVTLSALSALVNHLSGLREGRKSVLFVSEGPPVSLGNTPNDRVLRDVLQAANRGNVTIHVYDPQPLGFNGRGGRDVLTRLQRETGGRAYFNSNGSPEQITQVIDDASAYYLISYAPARDFSDGKFHRIEVRVRRDDARVVARNGYWAPTVEEMNPEVVAPLEPDVVNALAALAAPVGGRAADIWIGTARAAGAATRLMVTWDPSEDAGARRPVKITVEPLNAATQQSMGDLRPLASASAVAGAMPSMATFDVPPGTPMTLRFEATTADGTVLDRWTQRVAIPSFEGVSPVLSTARVYRARSAFEARALAMAASPAPSAVRRFSQTDRVFVEVDAYTTGTEPPVMTARLLNGAGTKLVDLMVPALTAGKARITLPIASLAASTYVLHIETRVGDQIAHERLAFRVAR